MFKGNEAFSGFSVNDLAAARAFYGDTLGLEVQDGPMDNLEIILGGGQHIFVYPKPNHEPATYTMLNIVVPDVEAAVDALVAKGVHMEQYGIPEMKQDARGISRDMNGPAIAWFKDPAGNIVSVVQTS